jgi:hypothetical protein
MSVSDWELALGGLGKARPAISLSVDHGMWDIGSRGVISLDGYIGNNGQVYKRYLYVQVELHHCRSSQQILDEVGALLFKLSENEGLAGFTSSSQTASAGHAGGNTSRRSQYRSVCVFVRY